MLEIFKRVIFVVVTSFLLMSCGVSRKQDTKAEYQLGASMKIETNIINGSMRQIDSLIVADTLISLDKWLKITYEDYETGEKILKRMYAIRHKNKLEVVYIIMGSEEPYKIIKRITQK